MKKILSMLLAILLITAAPLCLTGCNSEKTDDDDSSDHGFTENASDGLVSVWVAEKLTVYDGDTEAKSAIFEYDNRGNLLERLICSDGNEYKYSFSYDAHNNMIEEIREGYRIQYSYVYDENGNILEKTEHVGTMTHEHWKYTYDEMGKLAERECDGGIGDLMKEVYTYNDNGILQECVCYHISGAMMERTTYYESGQISGKYEYEYVYDMDTFGDLRYVYEYDEQGRQTKYFVEMWDMGEMDYTYSYDYEFDKKGRVTQYIRYENGTESERGEYTYDATNKMKGELSTNSGERATCEYKLYRVTPAQRECLNELGVLLGNEDLG